MRSLVLVIALIVVGSFSRLEALPIYSDPVRGAGRTEYGIDFWDAVLSIYDASNDHLRISSHVDQAVYRNWFNDDELVFTSFFEISANVDAIGRITNSGTMRWEGDFGFGRELLATGKLVGIGFEWPGLSDDVDVHPNVFSGLNLLLSVDFLDPRIQGMGHQMWFGYERQWPTRFPSPFMDDWACIPGVPDGLRCSEPYSTTGLAGVIVRNVPEPASLALFVLSLGLLVTFRYRRSSRNSTI